MRSSLTSSLNWKLLHSIFSTLLIYIYIYTVRPLTIISQGKVEKHEVNNSCGTFTMWRAHKKTTRNKNNTLSTYAYKNNRQSKSYFNICIPITAWLSPLEIHSKTKYHNKHNAVCNMRTHLSNFAPTSRPMWTVARSTNHDSVEIPTRCSL